MTGLSASVALELRAPITAEAVIALDNASADIADPMRAGNAGIAAAIAALPGDWPARLTPAMNRTLETTDMPFGKVVMPLGFRRERLEARRGRAAECPAGTVLSHRAVLRLGGGTAISLVVECYTRANLAPVRTAR